MLVTVDQLEVGDEFIVPCMSDLRYYRVERQPQPKKGSPVNGWTQRVMYKAVKCSYYADKQTYSSGYTAHIHGHSPENHNAEKFVDLNYKNIWLIKKA
jgi:hypothetical protein